MLNQFKSVLNNIKERIGTFNPNNIIANNARQLLLTANNDNIQTSNNDICLTTNGLNLQLNIEEEITKLTQRAVTRILKQELIKQKNLEQVLSKTEDILENEQTKSQENLSESINEDWLSYYIEGASKISDEQVQDLWAKILAGEIITPKTFSKRTLDVLLRLSPEEAKLFEKICGYVVEIGNNVVIINEEKLNSPDYFTYLEIMRLGECGLINTSNMSSLNAKVNPASKFAIIYGNDTIVGESTRQENIHLPIYPLTVTGIELSKIVSPTRKYDYLRSLTQYLKDKYKTIEWENYQVFKRDGQTVHYAKVSMRVITNAVKNISS